ncbi:MAG: class I SAM-dependent methyltransferase [Chloroflexi bacterium]|nr:class I SAM-dependent methyltransferase [Chloroflexota bacterium]
MNPEITRKLVDINDRFYQNFGAAFAETRRRIQPGIQHILETRIGNGDWLDLGCGGGPLGQALIKKNICGSYTGLDFSEPLLAEARDRVRASLIPSGFSISYDKVNLLDPDWCLSLPGKIFDGILAFAVFHHLPGFNSRIEVIQQAAALLKPSGLLIHSVWQFQNSEKLLARVQPWSITGISSEEVEPGDTLLDWRHVTEGQPSQIGLRYVHLFSNRELSDLAEKTGFAIIEEFYSDGKKGNLGFYQVWQKQP